MSGINGDKARFNRERKKKIARRLRKRALVLEMGAPKTSGKPASKSPGRAV
ncbi:MAG: hypothetical protein ABSE92_08380 [Terriglobales bacterium]|jgi:hypothetical protein